MGLSAVDHFLLADAQREQQDFQRNLTLEESGLRQQLANKTAAHKAYETVLIEILDAYETGDNGKLHTLLSNREARQAIYKPAFDALYNQMTNG